MRILLNWLLFLVVLFAAGCINVDYVGQRLAPLPEGQLVVFFEERDTYDTARYQAIGRARVEAPDGTGILDIMEKLQDYARDCGASAIKIVSMGKVEVGQVRVAVAADETLRDSGATGTAVGGERIYTDSFGESSSMPTNYEPKYEVVGDVIFLVEKEAFDRAMEERRILRETEKANEKVFLK